MRSVKNATLRFGAFVNLQIKLYSAARDEGSGLNLVHEHVDGSIVKINEHIHCSGCNSTIPREQLKRGKETSKNTYVIIDDSEIKSCTAPDSSDIVIEKFVDLKEVDPVFFDKSYFLAPDEKKTNSHNIAYELLLRCMQEKGVAGVATLTMKGTFHNVFIRVYQNGLMLHTIFNYSEIRTIEDRKKVEVNNEHLRLCGMLVDTLVSKFDPTSITNPFADKLQEIITAKTAFSFAEPTGTPRPSSTAQAGDSILTALAASLQKAKV